MKVFIPVMLWLCGFQQLLQAQSPGSDRLPGEIIVRLWSGEPEKVISDALPDLRHAPAIRVRKVLSSTAGIYLIENRSGELSDEALLDKLRALPAVRYAQFNYPVSWRYEPDDPGAAQQWYLDVIQAKQAWDIATGGWTAKGDTIVLALVDKGCDLNHPELAGNLWINHGEIPGDGIDNDDNGYTDDYRGWRFDTNNDNHQAAAHGTQIAGVIGAAGDNANGIAGINWNIRIMLLTMALNDADIIAACYYARDMRARYNASQGAEGAFVVAANFSFGYDNAWPADHPGWCDAFDDLGAAGIVSTGATNNEAINVDIEGDIPSTCPSDYLLVVTNTTPTDTRSFGAAWGPQYVDLGAPGTDIYTTTSGGDYATVSGTSFSAPLVAAAVALMYNLPAGELSDIALSDPPGAALLFRDFILDGVDQLSDLEGKTVTGGRLNLLKSFEQAKGFVAAPNGDLNILSLYPNPTEERIYLEYRTPGLYDFLLRIYDATGRNVYEQTITPYDDFNQPLEIDPGPLPQGIYILSIHNYRQVVSRKFLVWRE